MIVFTKTASIAPGKLQSALGYAHEISAYLKKIVGIDVEVLMPIGGNPMRVAWSVRHKDLAEYEVVTMKLREDKQYWEMIGKHTDLFLPGSVRDSLWRVS